LSASQSFRLHQPSEPISPAHAYAPSTGFVKEVRDEILAGKVIAKDKILAPYALLRTMQLKLLGYHRRLD
jgi:hypothetical protein